MYYPQIKALRLKRDYKQEYVAEVLSISQPEYSKLENGKRSPSVHDLKLLAGLYTVGVETILETDGRPPQPKPPRREGAKLRKAVPPEVVDSLIANYTQLMNNFMDQQAKQQQVMDAILSMKRSHT